ncbi:MAG: lipoyl(octanoyl) transferase LipB [Candidatus Binataceae bacterium]
MDKPRRLQVAKLGLVEYEPALALQQSLVAARLRDEVPDTLLLLEHPHVYTLGRGADDSFIKWSRPDVPFFRVSRGGQVTYHGPGQLVGYAIVRLDGAERDVFAYLRRIERALIDTLAGLGIDANRRDGFTGVWVGGRKIASIGVGIRRWVTCHGFALNVATDLSYFDAIVPCGIDGCEMTSLARLGRAGVSVSACADLVAANFARVFDRTEIVSVDAASLTSLRDCGAIAIEAAR